MGLDMYLSRRTYVQNWDHHGPENQHQITVMKGGKIREDIKPERISYIIEEVAYWRKANAIHRWFVENCQNGVDECQESYVTHEQLSELVSICKEILKNPKSAPEELPTQAGFFFGTTEYGEPYLDDLRETVRQLEPCLNDDRGEYYYRSSW